MCQSGIRPDMDYAQLAVKKYGVIRKAGAWFTVCDPYTGEVVESDGKMLKLNGLSKVYEFLQTDKEYFDKLKSFILNDINGTAEVENGKESDEVL